MPEHLARAGEIEAARGREGLDHGQQVVGAIDIDVEGGELVVEGVAYKALSRKVIAFLRLHVLDHPVEAGVAFQGGGMQHQAVADVAETGEAMVRVLEGDAADHPVNLIALLEEELRQIGAVLTRNPCNESAFRRHQASW